MPDEHSDYLSSTMGTRGPRKVKAHAIRMIVGSNVDKLLGGEARSAKTQRVAAAAKIDRRTVNRLVKGEYAANLDTLGHIADALNVKPLELFLERPTGISGAESRVLAESAKEVTPKAKSRTKR